MSKVIVPILLGIAVSFYFYPIEFHFLPPDLNTKQILAVIGLVIFAFNAFHKGKNKIHEDTITASVWAFAFSLACFISSSIFETSDSSYSLYFVTFFVWIFASYAICSFLRYEYGKTDMRTITYYLTAVAVVQCITAILVNTYPGFAEVLDSIVEQDQDFTKEVNRLYGIGASLDSGGVRFAATLLMDSYFIVECSRHKGHKKELWFLYISFIVITIYGNMIARTTIIGTILGLTYMMLSGIQSMSGRVKKSQLSSIGIFILIIAALVPLVSYIYVSNANAHSQLRFAFEGFFNYFETGRFSYDSTDKLNRTMWIWPKDTTTWILGTGKFDDWAFGTDIGYCRFILYCGLIGFSIFLMFFIHNAKSFARKFRSVRLFALMLMSLTLIIWIKVSTDIFQLYALLICADAMTGLKEIDTPEEQSEPENSLPEG